MVCAMRLVDISTYTDCFYYYVLMFWRSHVFVTTSCPAPRPYHAPPSRSPAAPATGIPLPLPSTRTYTAAEVFQCAEESLFYSQTLEKMLPTVQLRHAQRVAAAGAAAPPASPSAPSSAATAAAASTGADGGEGPRDPSRLIVAEFGTGDGTPVVSALLKTR